MIQKQPAGPGRVPFRIRIGVTGHRRLDSERSLSEVFERIRRLVPETEATPVRLAVVSALAEGADRVVVAEVFDHAAQRGEEARLEVVLPFERQRYVDLQGFSPAAQAEFEEWLRRATSVIELGATEGSAPSASYEAAGQHVVNRCDVLVALWDGRPSAGRGGTAETLLYAAELGKPCIWIPTDEAMQRADNFAQGSAAPFREEVRRRAQVERDSPPARSDEARGRKTLKDTFDELDSFNRRTLPPRAKLEQRLRKELGTLDETSDWVATQFARAAVLADRFQRRFTWVTWAMAGLATAAAMFLGAGVSGHDPPRTWAWAEFACLVALAVLFVVVHLSGLHRRWLSYRLLAERFRSAYFIAPTGIDFRRTAGLEAVFVERRSADWLLRAFEEVWDSRPHAVGPPRLPSESEIEALRVRLADRWIGGQISYHADARRRHAWRYVALFALILVFFVGALVFAFLHAATDILERPVILLSVTLPVAAAALGVVLTVQQHRALTERYERMHSDLLSIRRSLRAVDPQTIAKATSQAAQVIAEENGDWLGAMWFLDIEHPP